MCDVIRCFRLYVVVYLVLSVPLLQGRQFFCMALQCPHALFERCEMVLTESNLPRPALRNQQRLEWFVFVSVLVSLFSLL